MKKEYADKQVYWQQENVLPALAHELQQGNLLISSTDTVLGLLAPISQEGYQALNRVKKRSGKPYLILIGSPDQASQYADISVHIGMHEQIRSLMSHCWPGPLTLIVPAKSGIPDYIMGSDGTVALRVPSHAGLLALLAHFDGLFSTSANLSDEPVPARVDGLNSDLVDAVRYIVTDQDVQLGATLPSTILDCTHDAIRVVRRGAYSIDVLEQIGGKKLLL